jgi:hypothetical protein
LGSSGIAVMDFRAKSQRAHNYSRVRLGLAGIMRNELPPGKGKLRVEL